MGKGAYRDGWRYGHVSQAKEQGRVSVPLLPIWLFQSSYLIHFL